MGRIVLVGVILFLSLIIWLISALSLIVNTAKQIMILPNSATS